MANHTEIKMDHTEIIESMSLVYQAHALMKDRTETPRWITQNGQEGTLKNHRGHEYSPSNTCINGESHRNAKMDYTETTEGMNSIIHPMH